MKKKDNDKIKKVGPNVERLCIKGALDSTVPCAPSNVPGIKS